MEGSKIKLQSLNMDELAGVVHLYPWYAGARKELCDRMARIGGEGWGTPQYAEAALYIPAREKVSDIVRSTRRNDYSDKDLEQLVKRLLGAEKRAEAAPASPAAEPVRPVRVPGGDFFSSDQYASVRQEDDNFFSRMRIGSAGGRREREWEDPEMGFCTETLAAIYADQGYFAEAKKIYSRLILRFPEKSAYFASLIEKLDKEN